jgi:hypothetical protein
MAWQMNKWSAPIPKTPKQRDRKRCYTIWTRYNHRYPPTGRGFRAGGKVVWLTDRELTLAHIKYPNKDFEEVLERDSLELYKKYLDQTIE